MSFGFPFGNNPPGGTPPGGGGGGRGAYPAFPPPPGSTPHLEQQSYQSLANNPQVFWTRSSVADPQPLIPHAENGTLAIEYNTRTKRFSGNAAGARYTERFAFDRASVVYARTAGVRTADGSAFTYNGNVLDLFDAQFVRSNGQDRLDADSGMGSVLFGSAERPSYCGGPAWMFDNSTGILLTVTPLVADIVIDISLQVISIPTAGNWNAPG